MERAVWVFIQCQDVPVTKLCSQTLDRETSLVFGAAVETHYWYERDEAALSKAPRCIRFHLRSEFISGMPV